MKKLLLLVVVLFASQLDAKELPSWGMTESQYKMPNFTTKMSEIGDQAVNNDWLLKITAPKDWHSKIRAALTEQGAKNVQINFKDSLYKSIAITATPGMDLKTTTTQNSQPAVVNKQVVIEKPEIDTQIEAPEFENDFKADDILADIGEIELTLPSNGQSDKKSASSKTTIGNEAVTAEKNHSQLQSPSTRQSMDDNNDKQAIRENLRIRYARGKSVDKTISYAHITDQDDLFVTDDVVLVKRYVNRGVAIYYWMQEAYDPDKHQLLEKGSGKYIKTADDSDQIGQTRVSQNTTQSSSGKIQNPAAEVFGFMAVTDDQTVQDQLRRDFIRNKAVSSTLRATQLKSKDILYVSQHTVLVERPLGNSRSAYFWLEGDTDIQQPIEHMGPDKYVIQ